MTDRPIGHPPFHLMKSKQVLTNGAIYRKLDRHDAVSIDGASYRKLRKGDTVRNGDLLVARNCRSRVDTASIWFNHTLESDVPNGSTIHFARRVADTPDDMARRMVASTKRLRAQTGKGKLEKLLAQRAAARRQVTFAIARVQRIDDAIADILRGYADASFETELASITKENNPTT